MRSGILVKRISTAIIVSVIFHALVITFFLHRSHSRISSKKGIISVDFIQSIHHSPPSAVETSRDGRKKTTLRATELEVAPSTTPPGEPSASSPETDAYISAVLRIIHQRKIYPTAALDRGEEGRVVIGVSVNTEGLVLDVRIEESSPFARLNHAALMTVSSIKSFPPLPAGVSAPIHLHIPLVYRVETN